MFAYTAVCTRRCRNGGTCTAPNTCTCAPGWSGSRCTKGKLLLARQTFLSSKAEIFRDASFDPLKPRFCSKSISLMWDSHVMLDLPWLYDHHTIILIYSMVIAQALQSGPLALQGSPIYALEYWAKMVSYM